MPMGCKFSYFYINIGFLQHTILFLGCDSTDSSGASPGIYLREDPVGGTVQLGNVSEPQAVSAEKAAFYLDAALASRTTGEILGT